jgi:hypothetical protein
MNKIINIFLASVVIVVSSIFGVHAKEPVPKLLKYETLNIDSTSDDYWSGVVPYSDLRSDHKRLMNKYQNIILIKMANQMGLKVSDYKVMRKGIFEESSPDEYDLYYETMYKSICEVNIISVHKNGDFDFYTTLC